MDKRILIMKIIMAFILVILLLRAGQLQIINGQYYYDLSEGNRTSLRPISAPRGRIMDKNHNILVSNKLAYNLYLLPNEIPPEYTPENLLQKLCELTDFDYNSLINTYQRNTGKSSAPILLKRNISRKKMIIVGEAGEELPGLLVKESSIRDYVYGDIAPHMIGYVGEIGLEDLKKFNETSYEYEGGDIVGISGLEREYEFLLKGINGVEHLEVNSKGQIIRSLGIKPPVAGNDLVLNIDFKLQSFIEKLLIEQFAHLREIAGSDPDLHKPTGAATIVMNPNTGAILAMVSVPGYNLNDFAEGFSREEYQKLINNPLNPLLNRPIMVSVPPGSIFKLVTGTAGIEYLGVNADSQFNDKDTKFYIPNWSRPYRNWKKYPDGKISFMQGIARSNNVVFYQLGYKLYEKYKGEKLAWTARQFGLGSKTGIDLPVEKKGLVPDEDWKKSTFNEGWYPGDSVNLSIGQGGLLTTPLQLIDFVSAIANGGILYRPQLVDKILGPDGEVLNDYKPDVRDKLPFHSTTYKILRQGMTAVANSEYGTASKIFKDFPVKIAGKTGTAQTGTSRPNHGLFAGFAPENDPEIAVLVFLENGNSSAYTLPIAAEIFKDYFGIEELQEEK